MSLILQNMLDYFWPQPQPIDWILPRDITSIILEFAQPFDSHKRFFNLCLVCKEWRSLLERMVERKHNQNRTLLNTLWAGIEPYFNKAIHIHVTGPWCSFIYRPVKVWPIRGQMSVDFGSFQACKDRIIKAFSFTLLVNQQYSARWMRVEQFFSIVFFMIGQASLTLSTWTIRIYRFDMKTVVLEMKDIITQNNYDLQFARFMEIPMRKADLLLC
jgi:hypothetical protein